MKKAGKQTRDSRPTGKPAENASPFLPADRWRVLLLGSLTAIYVARPLLPSETPTTISGDGLPFAMLMLVLMAAWLLSQFAQPHGSVRFGMVEAAWLLLLTWLAVSTIVTSRSGYARAAINGFWEWIGLGAGFFLLRQLLRTAAETRALLAVMTAVALVLSLDGLYEFKVQKPLVRELYRRDPERVLAEARVNAAPGSQARVLFEQRLASSEPMATFALANSLAGLIAPWLLIALAIGWLGDDGPQAASRPWRRWMVAASVVSPMAACLLLTKSRAGYLATLSGFSLLALVSRRGGRQLGLLLAATIALVAVLAGAGLVTGALDREIVSEAFKSLSYRWQYWQGAIGIVAAHPWVGCGLGNFQDEYTRFKLPEASEVVADPHNFAFEVWAMAGTPALLALFAIFAGIAIFAFRAAKGHSVAERMATTKSRSAALTPALSRREREELIAVTTDLAQREGESGFSWLGIAASGVAGFVLAYLVGLFSTVVLPWPVLVAGCVVLPTVSLGLSGWIRRGWLPWYVPFCAALALAINLIVAGGISFSGVAGSLWLLVAVGMHAGDRAPTLVSRRTLIGFCIANAALFIACYLTAYRPVLACRGATAQAMEAVRKRASSREVREHLLAAAAADPLAAEPWQMLAEADFTIWLRQTERSPENWQQQQREFLRRRPHSSAAWHEAGDRYLAAAKQTEGAARDAFQVAAIEHLQRAAELYPNSAMVHADLALALAAAGHSEAGQEAAMALQLHLQTPHRDQKLSDDVLTMIQALLAGE